MVRSSVSPLRLTFVLCLVAGLMGVAAGGAAAATPITIGAVEENGFGRMVFVWPGQGPGAKVPRHKEVTTAGVLVLTFDEAFSADLTEILDNMPRYFAMARQDPDQKTLRFAMKVGFEIKTREVGRDLYIDLLPPNWRGGPPPLPSKALAWLKAEEDRLAAEEAARLAAEALPQIEKEPPTLILRIGKHEGFSRLVFAWNRPVLYSMIAEQGTVTLTFDRPAQLNLAQLRVDPPQFVRGATSEVVDDRLVVQVQMAPGTVVRDFREDLNVVIDVGPAERGLDPIAGSSVVEDEAQATLIVEEPLEQGATVQELADFAAAQEAATVADDPAAEAAEPTDLVPAVEVAETEPAVDEPQEVAAAAVMADAPVTPGQMAQVLGQPSDQAADTAQVVDTAQVADTEVASEEMPEAGQETVASDDQSALPPGIALASGDVSPDFSAAAAGVEPENNALLVQAELMGNSTRLIFPWKEHVGAAMFERADHLWIVFDRETEFDLSEITEEVQAVLGAPRVVALERGSALQFPLSKPMLITANEIGTRWTVMAGDVLLEPMAPINVERSWGENGEARIEIVLDGTGKRHWIEDSVVGDRMAVVTTEAPARGLPTRHTFIEFQALTTAHGLAIVPNADDVRVYVSDGLVSISRDQGLNLSINEQDSKDGSRILGSDRKRPAFMDFAGWRDVPGETYLKRNQNMLRHLAAVEEEELQGARIDYAQFLLGYKLAVEATGILTMIEADDPNITSNKNFRALRGVARYFAGQLEVADADLSILSLTRDRHAALWRATIQTERGNFEEARKEFELGELAVDAYEPDHQLLFRVRAAEAELQGGDVGVATFQLDQIPEGATRPRWLAEAQLARAALLERQGNSGEALEIYEAVAAGDDRQLMARARYARAALMNAVGAMSDDEVADELDRLRFVWRGDETELKVLARLGRFRVKQGEVGQGLDLMRQAVSLYYETDLGRQLAGEMTDVFASLFIDGGADEMEPVKALGLYYDFRELTPIGRRGDEMIRRLADRLVAVDLLDQASELLQHQVTHRLRGVARSQVATKLASIYLMDRKPDRALAAIRSTRQALLPSNLAEARQLLEARALSELGKPDHALDLISHIESLDADLLRADVLWKAERWLEAAEKIEFVLGDAWSGEGTLDQETGLQVMRAAIGYTLGDDDEGLRRIRTKYGQKMRAGPDAESFAIVTKPVGQENVQFRDLATKIADIDTLDRFLAKFREGYQGPIDDAALESAEG